MPIGPSGWCRVAPNVCLGTGALPYETPPENVLRLQEYASQFPEEA